jgi:anti-sigma regulatory factor (Ser/Thr protein kinase)
VSRDLDALVSVVRADRRFRVLATATDADTLLETCRAHRPDLVVLGPRLAAETHELLTDLRAELPWLSVLIEPAGDTLPPSLDELAGPVRTASWTLEPDTANIATARQLTAEVLRAWGCDHLIPDAQLVVTELVTNAIVHADSSCQLSLQVNGAGIRIAVTDSDRISQPDPQPFDLQREGGRGLLIVSTLASSWGIEPEARGKTVWADLVA